jgi:hypothetical protein
LPMLCRKKPQSLSSKDYRTLLSFDYHDLDRIIDVFIYWSKFVEYLIFRKENIYTYKKE